MSSFKYPDKFVYPVMNDDQFLEIAPISNSENDGFLWTTCTFAPSGSAMIRFYEKSEDMMGVHKWFHEGNHPHIQRFLGVILEPETIEGFEWATGYFGVVLERPSQRIWTLHDYILHRTRMDMTENIEIAMQITSALQFLHARGVIHGNLSDRSIYMKEVPRCDDTLEDGLPSVRWECAISDVAMWKHSSDVHVDRLRWMAPEQVQREGFDPTYDGDVWSLSLLLVALFTGMIPCGMSQSVRHIVVSIYKRNMFETNDFSSYMSEKLEEYLHMCMQEIPSDRPILHAQCLFDLLQSLLPREGQMGQSDDS